MSAIQLLEKIGSTANLKNKKVTQLVADEVEKLVDASPKIVCLLVPADDDSDDDGKGEEEIRKAS